MSSGAYPVYRDSGNEFIGHIPRGWMAAEFKRVASRITDGAHVSPETDGGEYDFVSTRDLGERGIDFLGSLKTTRESYRYLVRNGCRPTRGDVLFSKDGTIGRTTVVKTDHPFVVASSLIIIKLDPSKAIPEFLHYLFQSTSIRQQVDSFVKGAGLPRLSISNLAKIRGVFPPPDEQVQIVDFLDAETAKIDSLITKQRHLTATLREDRTATITHAITEGLDPAVELVQPNDEALPACPRHWTRQISLKRVASVQTGLTLGKTVELEDAVTVPYLRVANVQTSGVDLGEVKTVEVLRGDVGKYLLRTGDVLMTEGGDIDKLGRGCVWGGEISPCVHQNHVFAVRCSDRLASGFLVYLLDTSVARNYFFMTAKKTTNLASTNSTTLGAFTFSLPPRPEQNEIVKFLDDRCSRLDALTAKANEVISVLREYRAALITDAVTGKIDVRGAA